MAEVFQVLPETIIKHFNPQVVVLPNSDTSNILIHGHSFRYEHNLPREKVKTKQNAIYGYDRQHKHWPVVFDTPVEHGPDSDTLYNKLKQRMRQCCCNE